MRRSRLVIVGLTVALVVVLVGPTRAVVRAAPAPPLDLAALTVRPSDLEESGYGLTDSGSRTLAETAAYLNDFQGGNARAEDALRDALVEADWRQNYFSQIGVPSDEDPDEPRRLIYCSLTEFPLIDSAADFYLLLQEVTEEAGFPRSEEDASPDYDSAMFRAADADAFGLELIFWVDTVVVELAIFDYANDEPTVDDVFDLADIVFERIEAAQNGEAPGLGLQLLRLEGDGVVTDWDHYGRIDSETLPSYGQSEESFESDDDFFSEVGVTDAYFAGQSVSAAAGERDEPYVYERDLFRFESEDAAATWIADEPPTYAELPFVRDVEVVDDAEEVGDQSTVLAVTFDRESGATSRGYVVYMRVAEVAAVVRFDGVPEVPWSAVEELARGQAECLETDFCLERAAVPADLQDVETEPTATSTPVPTPEPTAADTPTPLPEPTATPSPPTSTPTPGETAPAVAGAAYTSPSFGYSLSWDGSWVVEAEWSQAGIDFLQLTNGVSTVVFRAATAFGGDPARCLEARALAFRAEPSLRDPALAAGPDGSPLQGEEEGRAWAVYVVTYQTADGQATDFMLSLECRTLVAGEAVLEINQAVTRADYDAQRTAMADLLAGLTLGPSGAA